MVVYNARENEGRALLEMLDLLRQGAQGSSAVTVRILAAADHDGVCAAKILVAVLQRAGVKYTVVPVTANTEIVEHLRQLGEDAEVRSLVLLNCGASLNLQVLLDESQAPSEVSCYVIDAHRPMALANLSARHRRVFVIDDDPIAEASGMRPPVDDDDEASDEDSSDGEKENVWDPEAPGGTRTPAERLSRKRRRAVERQERLERKRKRVNEYYMSAYCATPAAMSLFKMAKQAAAPSEDLLWVAAVSLTGYYDLGLVHKGEYDSMAWEELKEALDRTADVAYPSQAPGNPDPPSSGSFGNADNMPSERRERPREMTRPEQRQLRFETDLRLTLYKHWTLEESIMHSAYFYGTMELHRDKGQRALKNFFATAGIPPRDFRQLYSGMELPIRKTLHHKFRDHGRAYGLVEHKMFMRQFVRELGLLEEKNALFLHDLSCMDAAHVITALLSAVPVSLNGARLESLPQTVDGRIDHIAVDEMERQANVNNFWRAFDAVLCKDPGPLRDGIAEAVEMAKAVQSLTRILKDSKSMLNARLFRWCKIEQPPPMFRHPLAVRRLAVWLLQVLYAYRPKGEDKEKPLLVIVRDRVRDTYLCVGATPSTLAEQDEFAYRFRQVLRTDHTLKYRYDFFDKSCIEIAADDFDRFWDIMCS